VSDKLLICRLPLNIQKATFVIQHLFKYQLTGCLILCCALIGTHAFAQRKANLIAVDSGWANNSINVAVFRKNSLVSYGDSQFVAFYDPYKRIVLGKRKLGASQWILKQTSCTGNIADAHNIISLMVDGRGYLHLAFDHHNTRLRYCRSVSPGSLTLSNESSMTGIEEQRVTYPEFYRLKNGNLLFLYRSGESGRGNLVMNHYDLKIEKWTVLQNNLIDGQGQRSAYWQAYVDSKGTMHISWVWRETPDVASNHDLCYARSRDGGKTWENSKGEKYSLPITAATAEYACIIPQRSELINQTSMGADRKGRPFIATYWRDSASAIPQYRIVYRTKDAWKTMSLNFRTTAFSLSGIGTKRIPVSRPQIMVRKKGKNAAVLLVFRDLERKSRVSAALVASIKKEKWIIEDLTENEVGSWEPTYDTEHWKKSGELNLFIQDVEQVDGEGKASRPATMVQVLEWKPDF
jgi:hypothetical protein